MSCLHMNRRGGRIPVSEGGVGYLYRRGGPIHVQQKNQVFEISYIGPIEWLQTLPKGGAGPPKRLQRPQIQDFEISHIYRKTGVLGAHDPEGGPVHVVDPPPLRIM